MTIVSANFRDFALVYFCEFKNIYFAKVYPNEFITEEIRVAICVLLATMASKLSSFLYQVLIYNSSKSVWNLMD